MNMNTNFVALILLSLVWTTNSKKDCTVGDPLRENGTIVSCQKGSDNCPAPYRCRGGIPGLGLKGECCKDPYTLLCGPCIKLQEIYYKFDEDGSEFYVSLSFKWKNEDCKESAIRLKWDPFVRVLVVGNDNKTIIERVLNCRMTEKPCGKYFSMKIPLQVYIVLFHVEITGSSGICKHIEIAKVTPPPSKPSVTAWLTPPTQPPPVYMTVVVILSSLCVIVALTVTIYLMRMRYCLRAGSRDGEPNVELRPLYPHEISESTEDIFVVSLPGIGLTVIGELENHTRIQFHTIDQYLEDIFHNSLQWIDNVELKYNNIVFLLTENLVNDTEDDSNPLNLVSKQLFQKLRNSVLTNNKTHFYVYLEPPSIIERHFPCIRTRKNKYDLSRGHMIECPDFRHLVCDLQARSNGFRSGWVGGGATSQII